MSLCHTSPCAQPGLRQPLKPVPWRRVARAPRTRGVSANGIQEGPTQRCPASPLTRYHIYSLGVKPKSRLKLTGAPLATQTRMCWREVARGGSAHIAPPRVGIPPYASCRHTHAAQIHPHPSDRVWTALSRLGSFCPCLSLDPWCKKALAGPRCAVLGLWVPKPNHPSSPDQLSSAHSLGKHRLLRLIFSTPSIFFFSSSQENFSQNCSAASKNKP